MELHRVFFRFKLIIVLQFLVCKADGFTTLAYWALNGSEQGITFHGGPTFVDGRYSGSKAINFDQPSNCYAKIPKVDLRNINFTIAVWAKIQRNGHRQNVLNDWSKPRRIHFALFVANSLRLLFRRKDTSENYFGVSSTGLTVPEHKWFHAAVAWHQSLGVAKLFVDGHELAASSFSTNRTWNTPSDTYRIGNDDHSDEHQMKGSLMDLYIIDEALSGEQLNYSFVKAAIEAVPPQIAVIKNNDIVYTNETIQCRASGHPEPHVAWVRSGVMLVNGTSSVEITVAENDGDYECLASNVKGVKKVTVKAKAPLELCFSHSTIDDNSRIVQNPYDSSQVKNDTTDIIDSPKWYRLKNREVASYQLPTNCVPENRCGAQAPGWLNGHHPTIQDGVVKRTVCFHFHGNCCYRNTTVHVRKCYGYYLYKFGRVPVGLPGRFCMEFGEIKTEDQADSMFQVNRGTSMIGHVIYTVPKVEDHYTCMNYCMLYSGCKSFNFSKEREVCELNNETQRDHASDLKKNAKFTYYEKIELSVISVN